MRAALLALLLLTPALAGCAEQESQWAGVAEAWMYKGSALVEVQLHHGRAGSDADAQTARAGMGEVVAIEDARATLALRDGSEATRALGNWTFDRENDTASAALDVTRFDGFRLNATFVLRDGTRLATDELASWTQTYRRPYQATLRLSTRASDTSLTLSLYELDEGARELAFDTLVQDGTLTPVNVTRATSWRVTGTSSTGAFDDATPPGVGQTVRAVLPHTWVSRAELRYTLVLEDGTTLTDADVDGDVHPDTLALQQRFRQEN